MKRIKNIPFSSEEDESNHTEFSVTHKPDKAIKTKRMFFILLYVIFCSAYIVVFTVLTKLIPLIAILPLLFWMLWYFTWKQTRYDFTYIVSVGTLYIYKKDGLKRVYEIASFKVSEAEKIVPASAYDGKEDKKLLCCSSLDCKDLYTGVWNTDGVKTAVYFDASQKLLSALRYYAGDNIEVTAVTR